MHAALLVALERGEGPERWRAAQDLVDRADLADVRRLLKLLRRGASSGVREAAAWTLGRVAPAPPGGLAALVRALKDSRESPRVRAMAARALGERPRIRTERSEIGRALIWVLEHPDPELRYWAADSLGKLRFRPAAPALRRLAASDPRYCPLGERVCDQARGALRRLARRPGGTTPRAGAAVRG